MELVKYVHQFKNLWLNEELREDLSIDEVEAYEKHLYSLISGYLVRVAYTESKGLTRALEEASVFMNDNFDKIIEQWKADDTPEEVTDGAPTGAASYVGLFD